VGGRCAHISFSIHKLHRRAAGKNIVYVSARSARRTFGKKLCCSPAKRGEGGQPQTPRPQKASGHEGANVKSHSSLTESVRLGLLLDI
jgi:hypothetical protein